MLIQNHPNIKQQTCNKGLYGKWKTLDLEPLVKRVESMGYHLTQLGTIGRGTLQSGTSYDVPWNYTRQHMLKQCHIDHAIKFDSLGFIPPRCLECWKVVVGPRTLKELWALKKIQEGLDGVPCKCGIELRTYTPRHYGGYFYTDSLEAGRERYEQVRKIISEEISPDVKVILKRGCTEYEMLIGPSAQWYITDQQLKLDEYIESILDLPKTTINIQPEFIKAHTYRYWVEWAASHGDMTYKEFTNGEDLYEPPMTYHEGTLDDVKKELMAHKMHAKHGLTLDEATAHLRHINGVQFNTGRSMNFLGEVMGYANINPLSYGEHIIY